MKLQKRDCKIKVDIEPLGCYMLYVSFDFGGEKFEFSPSAAVGEQFGDFICALYTLYNEDTKERRDGHSEWKGREYHANKSSMVQGTTVTLVWDNEGTCLVLEMTKKRSSDIIRIKTNKECGEQYHVYAVNDRDFCYAVAKACTEAIKKYGFYGFYYSTGGNPVMLHQLLFLKAYALDSMQARKLTVIDEARDCCKSDFEKELELLLFDM